MEEEEGEEIDEGASDEESNDEGDEESGGDESDISDDPITTPINLSAETVLGNEDFRRIKKLKAVVAEQGSVGSEDISDGESSEGDERAADWILNPLKMGDMRKGGKKKDHGEATLERKENMRLKAETRRGGLTHKEKKRNKPVMMSVQKEHGRRRGKSAAQKFKELRTHITNLKKQVGPQKRRRTGGKRQ